MFVSITTGAIGTASRTIESRLNSRKNWENGVVGICDNTEEGVEDLKEFAVTQSPQIATSYHGNVMV